jgi:hypothetical protein
VVGNDSHGKKRSVSVCRDATAHAFFTERLSNHCQGLRRTFSEICTQFYAVPLSIHREIASGQIHDPLSVPSRNHIRPDTRLQIKGPTKRWIP